MSLTSLGLISLPIRRWLRWLIVALNGAVVIALAAGVQLSIASLQQYVAGLAAYRTAVQVCGHRPVLASIGFGLGTYILPNNSDYERLKDSTLDHLLLGTPIYFCTASDAEAAGYRPSPTR